MKANHCFSTGGDESFRNCTLIPTFLGMLLRSFSCLGFLTLLKIYSTALPTYLKGTKITSKYIKQV